MRSWKLLLTGTRRRDARSCLTQTQISRASAPIPCRPRWNLELWSATGNLIVGLVDFRLVEPRRGNEDPRDEFLDIRL